MARRSSSALSWIKSRCGFVFMHRFSRSSIANWSPSLPVSVCSPSLGRRQQCRALILLIFLSLSFSSSRGTIADPPLCLNSSLSSLSVCQRGTGTFHLRCGGLAIGVNGLGRMKRCVPLSGTAICFMRDQCGDPVADDGPTSRRQTITVTAERHRTTASLLP